MNVGTACFGVESLYHNLSLAGEVDVIVGGGLYHRFGMLVAVCIFDVYVAGYFRRHFADKKIMFHAVDQPSA